MKLKFEWLMVHCKLHVYKCDVKSIKVHETECTCLVLGYSVSSPFSNDWFSRLFFLSLQNTSTFDQEWFEDGSSFLFVCNLAMQASWLQQYYNSTHKSSTLPEWLSYISRVNIQLNPKKIATKGFLTDSDNIWCQK